MAETFKCGVCGALIDSETGETFVSKDSNAYKIETLKEKYDKSQSDLKRALDAHAELLERIKNGKSEEEPSGSGEGEVEGDVEGDTDGDKDGDKDKDEFWDE